VSCDARAAVGCKAGALAALVVALIPNAAGGRLPRKPAASERRPAVLPPSAPSADEAPAPAEEDPDRERILRLQAALYALIHSRPLSSLRVGVRVAQAHTGRLFYRRRADVLMDPASNQKVLATATALMRLGADWRFRTEVAGSAPDEQGTIAADVYLRGSGDPSLRAGDLGALADALMRGGVQRIDGDVVGDPRRIGSDVTAAGERGPLIVNRAAVTVRVRSGAATKAPAIVTVRPWSDAFVVRNRATTRAGGRTRIRVDVIRAGETMEVIVSGRIALHHPGAVIRKRVPHPALHAAALLREALVNAGISVGGAARVGHAPRDTSLLAAHQSQPLGVLIRTVNKDSDNEWAERVLETVGAEVLGGAGSIEKGVRVLREVIAELGLRAGSYVPVNGSGLGHANRITADAMAALLGQIYFDPRVGPEIIQSLSVGGVDGTTRARFRGSPASKRVRAKTGTLRGKSILSGYVGDGSDVLVFSIFTEGLRRRATPTVRAAQVLAVNAMMRYVRDNGDLTLDGRAPGERVEDALPGVDFETGEEATPDEPVEAPAPPGDGDPLDELLRRAKDRNTPP